MALIGDSCDLILRSFKNHLFCGITELAAVVFEILPCF